MVWTFAILTYLAPAFIGGKLLFPVFGGSLWIFPHFPGQISIQKDINALPVKALVGTTGTPRYFAAEPHRY